ncbi:GFA family protein [Paraburkholderia domus]|uniref:GFA family protein n=1 Tax=Paraburkholderia domus TaxID=2793075 RepID=UPI001914086B|nr:hypothetical protein [Paraburkholderia domus]CAE6805269.1 hypothetical protein R69749_02809 [Paraburkholderia domus]
MDKRPRAMATIDCECGQVTYEAIGAPITSVICYCDDCQEGARQIESLPHATSVQDPDGGTAYLVYRKDRVRCLKGTSLLRYHKIREGSATNRVIATCCNSAMLLAFDDGKHWVDLYRSRCKNDVLPVQMRICTKFKTDGRTIPTDVPYYSRYPMSLMMKLVLAKMAMLLHR